MKKDIHPKTYRLVAFKDMSNDYTFITKSTAPSRETISIEGVEYPLIKLEISNTSHPFYTGKMKLLDTAGCVDKFMNRYKDHFDKKEKDKKNS
jgi:large subunit ribosomal protein L31